jgi:flagellar biosynthetic protein FliO
MTVVLAGGALAIHSAQPNTAGKENTSSCSLLALAENEPNFSPAADDMLDTKELFFKMLFAVLLVIVLGAAAIYISKKVLPQLTNLPGKKIRVIETLALGQRKTVHLLEVDNRRFLIGCTADSITKLADMTDSAPVETDNA